MSRDSQLEAVPGGPMARGPIIRTIAIITRDISPVAALTSGGPPRKMVPCFSTIMLSSAMAGTYAPPAVHEPNTTAI